MLAKALFHGPLETLFLSCILWGVFDQQFPCKAELLAYFPHVILDFALSCIIPLPSPFAFCPSPA